MLTLPRPASVCSRSSTFSIGSPRNSSPPCCSSASSPRWIAPIDAAEMLPYDVCRLGALSAAYCSSARILDVEQQQSVVGCDLEHERKHTLLRLVKVQDSRQQQRTEIAHRRAHAVSPLAENVPEHDRHCGKRRRRHAD